VEIDAMRTRARFIVPAPIAHLVATLTALLACTQAWSQATRQIAFWGDNTWFGQTVPSGFSNVKQIASGSDHVMVLLADGTVTGWGRNDNFQIDGINPWWDSSKPVGLDGVKMIACGANHTAAIRNDGEVVCWGRNDWGQCRTLDGVDPNRWDRPSSLAAAPVSIACGESHTVVALANGDVAAWGRNEQRQCGGNPLGAWQAGRPSAISGVVQVACTSAASIALKSDGSTFGWGYNAEQQCAPRRFHSPIRRIASAPSAGHVLALLQDRTVKAWGWNGYEALNVPALTNVVDIAASYGASVALLEDGTVRCWGTYSTQQTTPPGNLTGVSMIACGWRTTLALKPFSDCNGNGIYDGDDVAWGGMTDVDANDRPDACQGGVQYLADSPDLGNPVANVTYTHTFTGLVPTDADVQITVTALGDLDASNEFFTVRVSDGLGGAATSLGKVFDQAGIGRNCSAGESVDTRSIPKDVFNAFVAGGRMSVSLLVSPAVAASECPNGAIRVRLAYLGIGPDGDCDGDGRLDVRQIAQNRSLDFDRNGRLDSCDCRDNPSLDRNGNGVLDALDCVTDPSLDCDSNGRIDTYELLDEPRLDCDANGKLDACDTRSRETDSVIGWGLSWQVDQKGLITRPVLQIECGYDHFYALQNDGTLVGWGYGWAGRLNTPANLGPVTQVACGGGHTYAIKPDGSLVGWGYNNQGQIDTPAGLQARQVSCGSEFTYALRQDGTVRGWGRRTDGITDTPSGLSSVVQIDCGAAHTYARKNDGSLVGWGYSGDARTTTPVDVGIVTKVSCGEGFTYALRNDGTVMGWGWGGYGALDTPSGLEGVVDVSCGAFHTFVLKLDGSVQGWGRSENGELLVPSGLTGIRAIACAGASTFVLQGAVDANANGRSDGCDLSDDPSLDRNGNGVIDILDIQRDPAIDCNSNGAIDLYDLIDHPEWDCDSNARIDSCDYAEGSPDDNLDGHLDVCSYARGDVDLDGEVGTADLAIVLLYIGEVDSTIGEFDGDNIVTTADIALLLLNFGPVTWP